MIGQQTSVRVIDGHSFPAGVLADLSRITYKTTPLIVTEISSKVFALMGAGGTVTAIAGSRDCAVVDTGFRPRVNEIRNAIASALQQSPRWLINTHWHFDQRMENQHLQKLEQLSWPMRTAARACPKSNMFRLSTGESRPRCPRHTCFH
jgi:hypothetical protein